MPTFSAEELWRTVRLCRIDTHIGLQDIVAHNAGKIFMARAFQDCTTTFAVNIKTIPVKAPHSMSTAERYHTPVRKAYRMVRTEASNVDREAALQISIKADNDSVRPNRLVPTLSVYGGLPRLDVSSVLAASYMYTRAHALHKAANEISKYNLAHRTRAALRAKIGPQVFDMYRTSLDHHDLVCSPTTVRWDGPFTLLQKEGKDFTIHMDHGPYTFQSKSIKSYRQPRINPSNTLLRNQQPTQAPSFTPVAHLTHRMDRDPPRDPPSPDSTFPMTAFERRKRFDSSRFDELRKLVNRGVLEITLMAKNIGHRIYGARLTDEIKIFWNSKCI